MIICPVSHICDGQKTCFPTMLQTSFLAQEIISLKLSKTQNFRKMRQFLNRAVINGLMSELTKKAFAFNELIKKAPLLRALAFGR